MLQQILLDRFYFSKYIYSNIYHKIFSYLYMTLVNGEYCLFPSFQDGDIDLTPLLAFVPDDLKKCKTLLEQVISKVNYIILHTMFKLFYLMFFVTSINLLYLLFFFFFKLANHDLRKTVSVSDNSLSAFIFYTYVTFLTVFLDSAIHTVCYWCTIQSV